MLTHTILMAALVLGQVPGGTESGIFEGSAVNSSGVFTIPLLGPNGSASAPTYSFSGDPNNGLYLTGADSIGLSAGGGLRMRIDSNGIYGVPYYSDADGTSGAARFSWTSDTDLGLYRVSANRLGLAASSGVLLNGGLTMGGDLDMDGNDIIDLDDAYATNLAADTLPRSTMIIPQHAWAQSTTGANYIGTNLIISGGIGAHSVAITAAGSGGNTINVYHNATQTGGANTLTTYTSDAGGWTCSTETDAVCACNLYAIITGAPVSGWTVERSDGTCSDAKLFFMPDATTHFLDMTETGATFVLTEREHGAVLLPDGSATDPILGSITNNDGSGTGWAFSNNIIRIIVNGTQRAYWTTSGLVMQGEEITDTTRALNIGAIYAATQGGVTGSITVGEDAGGISGEVSGLWYFMDEAHFANNAAAATFGAVVTDADVVLAFDAVTAQGSITYMEDEDRFDFDNDVDVIGDLTAGTVASDGDVTAGDDVLLADGAVVGITGNEVMTFNAAGNITISGATLDVASAKGAKTSNVVGPPESVTFPGGGAASQVTTGSIIPDGVFLEGISTYVTTADNGGACTGYTVGDGVDDDLYGVAATETQGTTTTPASATASIANPQFGGPFEVTITGTGGDCIDMVVRITAHYRLISADTTL